MQLMDFCGIVSGALVAKFHSQFYLSSSETVMLFTAITSEQFGSSSLLHKDLRDSSPPMKTKYFLQTEETQGTLDCT